MSLACAISVGVAVLVPAYLRSLEESGRDGARALELLSVGGLLAIVSGSLESGVSVLLSDR